MANITDTVIALDTGLVGPGGTGSAVLFNQVFNTTVNSNGSEPIVRQFADGTYAIAPAVGETDLTFTAINTTSPGSIRAQFDPDSETFALLPGYTNSFPANEVVAQLPLTITPAATTSLVIGIKRNETTEGWAGTRGISDPTAGGQTNGLGHGAIDAYQIITIFASDPGDLSDSIRPPINGDDKSVLTLTDDFDMARLPSNPVFSTASAATLETMRQLCANNIEAFAIQNSRLAAAEFNEGGRAYRAHVIVDDYSAGYAQSMYAVQHAMMSADTFANKKATLAAYLAHGRDVYAAVFNHGPIPRASKTGAGQHFGRLIASIFFSALSVDPRPAKNISGLSAIQSDGERGYIEVQQVRDVGHGAVWGDENTVNPIGTYWDNCLQFQAFDGAVLSGADNGIRAQRDPEGYIDGPAEDPGSSYMSIFGPYQDLSAMMFNFPETADVFNYDPTFQYVDRLISSGIKTLPDPYAPPDPGEGLTCNPFGDGSLCTDYGITWGPSGGVNGNTPILNGAGQNGRFGSKNGTFPGRLGLGGDYRTQSTVDNWATIRGVATNPRTAPENAQPTTPVTAGA